MHKQKCSATDFQRQTMQCDELWMGGSYGTQGGADAAGYSNFVFWKWHTCFSPHCLVSAYAFAISLRGPLVALALLAAV